MGMDASSPCHLACCLSFLTFLSPALEEQLAATHLEMEEAYLWEVLLMEDRKRATVARIRWGAGFALAVL